MYFSLYTTINKIKFNKKNKMLNILYICIVNSFTNISFKMKKQQKKNEYIFENMRNFENVINDFVKTIYMIFNMSTCTQQPKCV